MTVHYFLYNNYHCPYVYKLLYDSTCLIQNVQISYKIYHKKLTFELYKNINCKNIAIKMISDTSIKFCIVMWIITLIAPINKPPISLTMNQQNVQWYAKSWQPMFNTSLTSADMTARFSGGIKPMMTLSFNFGFFLSFRLATLLLTRALYFWSVFFISINIALIVKDGINNFSQKSFQQVYVECKTWLYCAHFVIIHTEYTRQNFSHINSPHIRVFALYFF